MVLNRITLYLLTLSTEEHVKGHGGKIHKKKLQRAFHLDPFVFVESQKKWLFLQVFLRFGLEATGSRI